MPLSPIPSTLPTSTYEHLVLEALGEIAVGSTINYNPPILDTALFRHLVLNALQYIANNPGGGGTGNAYYGQVSRITSGTINIATAGTYQSTGLTATLDSENFGISLGTTDTFAVKNTSGSAQLLKIYGSADIDAGNNTVLGIKLALNGTPINNTECNSSTGQGTTFAKLVTNWMIELQPNDEVALFVTNKTTAGNVTLLRGRLVASTVGKQGPISPQGTGVVKVVNGVFQSPASTIVNADVSATAAIDVSKLSGVAGTAVSNTFTSNQIVSTTSESAALRVTQLGSGEAFRVEDETSPDSTAFVISNNGRVGIGVAPDANVGLSVSSSGIKFSDGSIQSSSATGIKTVLAQTTQNVSGSVSGSNFLVTGTLTLVVDGYIPPVNGIVVFASQTDPVQNGFWRVVVNNGSTQPALERPTWFSSTTTNVSPLVYITRFGATQAGFVMALTGPLGNSNIVVGTTALTVHRISGRASTVGIVAIPVASNSAGAVGQIAVDDANNFLYVCTAANAWKRTALTTF